MAAERLKLSEYKERLPDRPVPPPLEYAGQWVAWTSDRSRIVAHGDDSSAVRAEAIAAGCTEPLMQKVIGLPLVGGV